MIALREAIINAIVDANYAEKGAPMRHASSRCTLEVYSQAKLNAKREVQKRLVEMILSDEESTSVPPILGSSHAETQ